jgi:hypothetical protein
VKLLVEIGREGRWAPIGELRQGDEPGSMSNVVTGRREIIAFRCEGTHSVIERSKGGVDFELNGSLRMVSSLGFDELARLEPRETYECDVQTDSMGTPARLRFTHE